jgi:hypothetical protein
VHLVIFFSFAGPFEKIPLALVLSSDPALREFPRHLHLARLLVERGANPNLRILQAEWPGASPSPMEYVLSLYEHADPYRNGNDALLVIKIFYSICIKQVDGWTDRHIYM